jgi:hypothetical protein
MPWTNHPLYQAARKRLIKRFTPARLQGIADLPRIVFLCGGNDRDWPNRRHLEDYFERYAPKLMTFRAETAWDVLKKESGFNALSLEKELAELSDAVVVLVESVGSIAELGAFSLSDDLRPKLLAVLDRARKGADSFIETGPVAWIRRESIHPPLYVQTSAILEAAGEIQRSLQRRPRDERVETQRYRRWRLRQRKLNDKEKLLLLTQLVWVMGPARSDEIASCFRDIVPTPAHQEVEVLLRLARALGLIEDKSNGDPIYFVRGHGEKLLSLFSPRLSRQMDRERAEFLSSVMRIPKYLEVYERVVVVAD